ncbi:hypothetical protein KKD52_18675 [Myxococcota bacterium]|nr:hypothetical protein [Myxococcota bacterium]MBU1512382.1 hypothetical protein [Myxococcota bacterium]
MILAWTQFSCGGTDLRQPPDPELELQSFAQYYCARIFSCCAPATYATEAQCVTSFLERNRIPGWDHHVYDPWRLSRCLKARWTQLDASCDETITFSLKECLNLTMVTEAGPDFLCSVDRDCPHGQFCQPDGGAAAFCAPLLGPGKECYRNDSARQCANGLVCRPIPYSADTDRCEPPIESGFCASSIDCGSRTRFDLACIEGTCAALLPDGASCRSYSHLACASGFCDDAMGRCAPLTLRHYCEDLMWMEQTYEMDFDRDYSRY